jgi:hypothetical protein
MYGWQKRVVERFKRTGTRFIHSQLRFSETAA